MCDLLFFFFVSNFNKTFPVIINIEISHSIRFHTDSVQQTDFNKSLHIQMNIIGILIAGTGKDGIFPF